MHFGKHLHGRDEQLTGHDFHTAFPPRPCRFQAVVLVVHGNIFSRQRACSFGCLGKVLGQTLIQFPNDHQEGKSECFTCPWNGAFFACRQVGQRVRTPRARVRAIDVFSDDGHRRFDSAAPPLASSVAGLIRTTEAPQAPPAKRGRNAIHARAAVADGLLPINSDDGYYHAVCPWQPCICRRPPRNSRARVDQVKQRTTTALDDMGAS